MTATLKIKHDRYYAVINYKEGNQYKQKWVSLGLPVKNNKRKADAMLDKIKQKYEEIYATPCGDMPFISYIRRWIENKKQFIELSTWESYQLYAEKHIIPYFEPLQLSLREIQPQHIKAYYNHKYTTGRMDGQPGGLSITTIKKHGVVLKEVLGEAFVDGLILRNPAVGVRMPAKEAKTQDRVFLTADEANEMLKCFDGHPLQPLVYVTIYYGLRRSEVLGLKWSAIDFERNTLTINHTVVQGVDLIEKDTTKTEGSRHTYDLIDDVKEVLIKYKAMQQQVREEYGIKTTSDYVFTWADGSLFKPEYVTRGFQRVLAAHNLPKMRFHDLRHSTASILYDKGWDLKDIQIWLRHSNISVTADVYTHISNTRKSKMAQGLNSTFKL